MSHFIQVLYTVQRDYTRVSFALQRFSGLNKMAVVCLAVLSLLLSCVALTHAELVNYPDYFVSEHHVIKISPV